MRTKGKRAASGRRNRISRRRSERKKKPSNRSPWLTVLSEEGEANENEEPSEEDEELSGGASQSLRIRRE
jgi:hypothetical protein